MNPAAALFATVGLLILTAEVARADSFRTWTDATGKYQTVAEFLSLKDGKVRLKKKNGNVVTLPIEKLSAADQDYARKQTASATKPTTTKTPPKPNTTAKEQPEPTHSGQPLSHWIAKLQSNNIRDRINGANSVWVLSGREEALKAVLPLANALDGLPKDVLASDVEDLGEYVARALEGIGPEAKPALPVLLRILENGSVMGRFTAADAIGAIGPDAKSAVPALVERFRDGYVRPTNHAFYALRRIGPDAEPAIPSLIDRLPAKYGYFLSPSTLAAVGRPAVPALIIALDGGHPYRRSGAAEALGKIGKDARRAIPALRKRLTDESAIVRSAAALALWRLGEPTEQSVNTLIGVLKQDNDETDAIDALAEIGPNARDAVPILIDILKKDSSSILDVGPALGMIGTASRTAVPTLCKIVERKNQFREYAAEALGQIGSPTVDSINVLVNAAKKDKDGDGEVRYAAIDALGSMGPSAKSAISDLNQIIKDKDEYFNLHAMLAVAKIDRKDGSCVKLLSRMLEDYPSSAAEALGEYGPAAVDAIPSLIEVAKSSRHGADAGIAVWKISKDPKRTVSLLLPRLREFPPVNVIEVLGEIGANARAAVPRLTEYLVYYPDAGIRLAAAAALAQIDSEAAVTGLVKATKHARVKIRMTSLESLGKIGPVAKSAIPALIAALQDQYIVVRIRAAEALGTVASSERDVLSALSTTLRQDNSVAVRLAAEEAVQRITRATERR